MSESRVVQRVLQGRAWLERTEPGAIAIRLSIYVSGLLAVTIAVAPVVGVFRGLAFGLMLPVLPAIRPTKAWATLLIAACVLVWALGGEQSYAVAFVLGGLLYVHHTSAAQGVTVRSDTYVTRELLLGWVSRTGFVLLGAGAASLLVGFLPGLFGRTSVIAYGLAGLAAVIGLGAVVTWLAKRKL